MDEIGDTAVPVDPSGELTRPTREHAPLAAGEVVGRYVVLSQLGAGGMGVVHVAYDPELDRKVAIKLLHDHASEGSRQTHARERLLREAQALARFSHPEIVAIHDVGEHESRVFIAMEFVQGSTLRAWASDAPRSWQDVVRVMLAAARGVAAAHRAGLVHRDLKPDNIMVGVDGRVRVMDFGLTRARGEMQPIDSPGHSRPNRELLVSPLTQAGSLLGTPAYMAPEQFAGSEVTPATDQFSFCVTIWELLYGERPFAGRSVIELAAAVLEGERRPPPRDRRVPVWLRRAVERGLAVDPQARWPAMDALIDELRRGRKRVRRRYAVAAVGFLGACVLTTAAMQHIVEARSIAACEREGAVVDELWNDDARRRVADALSATGVGFAASSIERLVPHVERSAEEWRTFRTKACLAAEVDRVWRPEIHERSLFCLEQGRLELASLLARLGRADEEVARMAVRAAASLESMAPCVDETVLQALPDPPAEDVRDEVHTLREQLAEARVAQIAGKPGDGLVIVGPTRERAEQLGWLPLLAAVRHQESLLLEAAGDYAKAEEAAVAAYFAGANGRVWGVAADAATSVVGIVGHREARPDDALVWARHAELAISLGGDPLGLREALRLNNLALAHDTAGDYAEAKALYERSVATLEEVLGTDHPELAPYFNNLASAYKALGDLETAKRLFERSLSIRERSLGADHPDIGPALNNLAVVELDLGEVESARALNERALEIQEAALGPEHPHVGAALANLGHVERKLGHDERAHELYERALAVQERSLGPRHPALGSVLNNLGALAYAAKRYGEAKANYERALSIWEESVGTRHPNVAACLGNLGYAQQALGDYDAAKSAFVRASEIWGELSGAEHPDVAYVLESIGDLELGFGHPREAREVLERAVAIFDAHEGEQASESDARFGLARALVETGGDEARAIEEARAARHGHAAAGPSKAERVARIDAWLVERERARP